MRQKQVGAFPRRPRRYAQSGRSTLLTTMMTGSWAWRALRSTKRVCGSGPFRGIDQEDDAVDHGQASLNLTTKVGVAGGVDNVDDDAILEAQAPERRGR